MGDKVGEVEVVVVDVDAVDVEVQGDGVEGGVQQRHAAVGVDVGDIGGPGDAVVCAQPLERGPGAFVDGGAVCARGRGPPGASRLLSRWWPEGGGRARMSRLRAGGLMHIICADWGKKTKKRAAVIASVTTRRLWRIDGPITLGGLVTEARKHRGPVVIGIDAPLGVPASFSSTLKVQGFRDLLAKTGAMPAFFAPVSPSSAWTPAQPFFSVPAGKGGLGAFAAQARSLGVDLRREIDVATGGKSPFIVSGIPGAVGGATVALWQELRPLLGDPGLHLWPFDGTMEALLSTSTSPVILAEIYPRAAYATALLDGPPLRARLIVKDKTNAQVRKRALAALSATTWVATHGVTIDAALLADAHASDDVFDALLAAAALLRVVVEEEAWSGPLHQPHVEGGILGTGGLDLSAKEQTWAPSTSTPSTQQTSTKKKKPPSTSTQTLALACPIPGCAHVFVGGRGGWDAHVASPRMHPTWHPNVVHAAKRKRLFRQEFPHFFG